MRVILNAASLRPPLSGIGRYTSELAKGLTERLGPQNVQLQFHGISAQLKQMEKIVAGPIGTTAALASRVPFIPLLHKQLTNVIGRSRKPARNDTPTVYHDTNNLLSPVPYPRIATIHDLSVIKFPEFHPAERVRLFRAELHRTIGLASHLITDSEAVAQDLIEHCDISHQKISVIPLGVQPQYCAPPNGLVNDIAKKYGLQAGQYILTVGTLEPRKNLLRLIQAHKDLPDDTQRSFPLIHVGPPGWHNVEKRPEFIQAIAEGRLLRLGFVDEADMPGLYAGAAIFALPSLEEGFGFPLLEAQACGVPVIASELAVFKEISSAQVRTFNPVRVEEITRCMVDGLNDSHWHGTSRIAGPVLSQQFSWDRCVENTLNVYQRVLKS